jgi:hypothetical protein
MPSRDEGAAGASAGWWWLNLETGAAFQAKETTGPMLRLRAGHLMLLHLPGGGGPGGGIGRVICYGPLEELRDMVRRWLGDDLYIEESLLEVRTGSHEEEPLVSRGPHGSVNGYKGPLSSPWAMPLPKTVAEARSLGEQGPVGMEEPVSVEAFLQRLVGVWVLCSNVDDVPDPLAEPGLVIDPDGRWTALLGTDDELHRSTGWGTEGDWVVRETFRTDGVPMFQFDLIIDGDGTINAITTFATSPPLMRLEVPGGSGQWGSPNPSRAVGQTRLGPERGGPPGGFGRLHLEYVRLDRSIPRQSE